MSRNDPTELFPGASPSHRSLRGPRRVLVITNTYPPHTCGAARSIRAEVEALRARGLEVEVLTTELPEGAPEPESGVRRVRRVEVDGRSPHGHGARVPSLDEVEARIDDLAPDLVHVHSPLLLGAAGLELAAARRLPLVLTHRRFLEPLLHYVPDAAPNLGVRLSAMTARYATLAHAVISPGRGLVDELRLRGVRRRVRTLRTPLGDDWLGRTAAARPPEVSDLLPSLPREAFVLGCVGRMAPEKGTCFLVDAALAFLRTDPSSHLIVAGRGASERSVHERVARSEVRDRVHLLGHLEERALEEVYRSLSVNLYGSTTPVPPRAVLEAFAREVPVVSLEGPGVREVLRDGENGLLVRRRSVDAFAHTLRHLRELSPEARGGLRRAARATAEAHAASRTAALLGEYYADASRVAQQRPLGDQARELAGGLRRAAPESWRIVSKVGAPHLFEEQVA